MTCKTQKCKYEGKILGDCHICCNHPLVENVVDDSMKHLLGLLGKRIIVNYKFSLANEMGVSGDIQGIKEGWFNWPFNFDPVWLISCDKFEPAE